MGTQVESPGGDGGKIRGCADRPHLGPQRHQQGHEIYRYASRAIRLDAQDASTQVTGPGPLTVAVNHTLSARFVEISAPVAEEFVHVDVRVRIEAHVEQGKAFATLTCNGTPESPAVAGSSSSRPSAWFPFMLFDPRVRNFEQVIRDAWDRVEPVLLHVGTVLRWRFGLFGDDMPFARTEIVVQLPDGDSVCIEPMPTTVMGDDIGKIDAHGLRPVVTLVQESIQQPVAHELWREAWNLRNSSPRSSLVIGVAAAEVGIKQLAGFLVPGANAIIGNLPSPPIDTLIRAVLPELPVLSGTPHNRRCPQLLRKTLITAVEARNRVVHRGMPPQLDLRRSLLFIREFLYLLDYHAGCEWAEGFLSVETRKYLA
jgi:hypothetical protein